jgi:primase-polymerase (primpol)-like protein
MIPQLQPHNNWVAWRKVWRDGKWTKAPIDAKTGRLASSTDGRTWADYATALAYYRAGRSDGIGFVLTLELGIVFIDLDHVRDPATGEIAPWAMRIIRRIDSYTELSPSKTGVHILASGALPPGGRRREQAEMYSESRYTTVTGLHLPGTPETIERRDAEIAAVHAEHIGIATSTTTTTTATTTTSTTARASSAMGLIADLDDMMIIERAKRAANGDEFARLMAGEWSAFPSQSEAELALCSRLVFWFAGDRASIDRVFRPSALFRPGKWDRRHFADGRTYGEATLDRAIGGAAEFYTPSPPAPSPGQRAWPLATSRSLDRRARRRAASLRGS